jgi:FtsP/CotA-like multicopper oxidase with cupredoxin domain
MRLLPQEIMSGSPVRSRDISLGDDPGINGALWDVNRIDITAQQGTWERWTVRSDMPQSFHIEGVLPDPQRQRRDAVPGRSRLERYRLGGRSG